MIQNVAIQNAVIKGSRTHAPSFQLQGNAVQPSWSGKAAWELSGEEVRQLHAYCDDAGEQAGRSDADTRTGKPGHGLNPFHPAYLAGVPHAVWILAYCRGVARARAEAPASVGLWAYRLSPHTKSQGANQT